LGCDVGEKILLLGDPEKIGMFHGLLGSESLLMIALQQFVEQVQSLRICQMLVIGVNEYIPFFPCMEAQKSGH